MDGCLTVDQMISFLDGMKIFVSGDTPVMIEGKPISEGRPHSPIYGLETDQHEGRLCLIVWTAKE